MSLEAKERFRRGWEWEKYPAAGQDESIGEELGDIFAPEDTVPHKDSILPELADNAGPPGPVDLDERPDLAAPASAGPTRWIFVGGGVLVLGLVLAVGFFVFSGSESTDTDAAPAQTEAAAPDVEEPVVADPAPEEEPQSAVEEGQAADEDRVAIEIPIPDGTVTYQGPTSVTSGGVLEAQVCVVQAGGPAIGLTWLVTLGDPPSAPEASHGSGVLDAEGCANYALLVNWPAGVTRFWTSDGDKAWPVTPITVDEATAP